MMIADVEKGLKSKRVRVVGAFAEDDSDVLEFAIAAAHERLENLFGYRVKWTGIGAATVTLHTD